MMINRSKSTLFLIEQLIVVAVFAICAVACIRIISTAYLYSRDSRDVGFAIIAAENLAERFKVSPDGFDRAQINIYYDKNWQIVSPEDSTYVSSFDVSNITEYPTHRLIEGNINVKRNTGDELISFNVAAISRAGQGD